MSDSQFPDGLCSLMMDLRAAVDDPMSYLVKKALPKLTKKHLRIRKKIQSI
jgi:hypothetical protein